MKMNTITHTVAGRRHRSMAVENQDVINCYEDDRVMILAVADGCSSSECATPAAEATVAACIEFGMNPNIFEMKDKPLKDELLHILDKHYYACKDPYDDLAATALVLIVNKISGQYLGLSVGDSSCIVLTDTLDPALLISPVNILKQKDLTIFANSSYAARSMQIERGSLSSGIAGFIVLSDGADAILDQSHIDDIQQLASLTVLSPDKAQTALCDYIEELSQNTADDITIGITMRADDNDLLRIAAATYSSELTVEDIQLREEIVPEEEPEQSVPESAPAESLIVFLKNPRTAEELLIAGYVKNGKELLTMLYPYLRDGLIHYKEHHFCSAVGG